MIRILLTLAVNAVTINKTSGINMSTGYRVFIVVLLLVATVVAYGYGFETGAIALIALAMALELVFWLRLTKLFKKTR